MEYSLTRLSLFQALAWDPIYQKHKKNISLSEVEANIWGGQSMVMYNFVQLPFHHIL